MIFYFSGTGNSRAVAEMLAGLRGDNIVCINPKMIAEEAPEIELGLHDSNFIWVFPVHSWGLPSPVIKVIRSLVIKSKAMVAHHMVATCGDDCGLTDKMWETEIRNRGWEPVGFYTVRMPNTYVGLPFFDVDSPKCRDSKLAAMKARVEEISDKIGRGMMCRDIQPGHFAWIKTKVVYPYFMKKMIDPSRFRFERDLCVECGRCMDICPTGNLILNPKPEWGDNCCGCLACYHACPAKAIEYGFWTTGKGQYYFKAIERKA